MPCKAMDDVGGLRLLASQKLASRRKIVEEVAHLDLRSDGAPISRTDSILPPQTTTSVPAFEAGFASRQPEPRNAGDARKASPRNPIERTSRKIRAGADLARRMTLQTEQSILPVHAAAIIAHRDKTATSADILDPNPGSSGVEAVLNKFLDQRRRPLDHLPRRNLAGNDIWKKTNFSHASGSCRTC